MSGYILISWKSKLEKKKEENMQNENQRCKVRNEEKTYTNVR